MRTVLAGGAAPSTPTGSPSPASGGGPRAEGAELLTIVTWKWRAPPGYRSSFTAEHVNTLARMVGRHYARPHRVVCITDDDAGIDAGIGITPLWSDLGGLPSPHGPRNPSCYRRLRAFSAEAAELIGERFVSLDLDCVITGDVTPLWDRPEDFVIWGDTNPTTFYNGGMWLLRAGTRRQVWDTFDPVQSPRIAQQKRQWGSDQGWIGACLGPDEAKWGTADGVYSYRNHIQPTPRHGGTAGALPANAKVVMFHGAVDPWSREAQALGWVQEHWR